MKLLICLFIILLGGCRTVRHAKVEFVGYQISKQQDDSNELSVMLKNTRGLYTICIYYLDANFQDKILCQISPNSHKVIQNVSRSYDYKDMVLYEIPKSIPVTIKKNNGNYLVSFKYPFPINQPTKVEFDYITNNGYIFVEGHGSDSFYIYKNKVFKSKQEVKEAFPEEFN